MTTDRASAPRIPPLAPDERTEAARQLLDSVTLAGESNIFTTLVRAEGLFRRWMPFGGKLLSGKLPARDRELMILRTGWNCGCEYEWGQHVSIGLRAGLTQEEIDAVPRGPEGAGAAFDATLLRAADELHSDFCISDPTWEELSARYGTEQLIELPMLVGHYHLVAMTLNTLGVQLDAGLPGFPS